MARSVAMDLLQVFRFSVRDAGGDLTVIGEDVFSFGGGEEGGVGFAGCSGLELTAETEEIREGNWPFPHHVIKGGAVGQVTLRRGILPRDSDFYNWFNAALFGFLVVRRHLVVTMLTRGGLAAKAWLLHSCIPTACTVWPELDASSNEIAYAELTVQPAYVEELDVSTV